MTSQATPSDYRDAVKRLAKQAGRSLASIQRDSGISQSTWDRRMAKIPSLFGTDELARIAEVLGLPASAILLEAEASAAARLADTSEVA